LYGFRYIFARPSLLALQLVFLAGNLIGSAAFVLLPALILSRTGNNEITLGTVQSALGIGGVIGGVLLSTWGGTQRRIHTLLISWTLAGLLGEVLMGLGQTPFIWGMSAFFTGFFIPFINGSNQAIWQAKVAPDVQGRVFAARRLIAQIAFPLSMLLAGPLADHMFEPAMQSSGALAPIFGDWVGTGNGAGLALMFVGIGLITALIGLSGYLFPVIRNAEDILPDHDALPVEPPLQHLAESEDLNPKASLAV
jgi:predicted MFS family arabinose efflux permease